MWSFGNAEEVHRRFGQVLQYPAFSIDILESKAALYTDGAPFVTATSAQVVGDVALLALPASVIEKDFGSNYSYFSYFVITQPEMFSAVLRFTRSSEADWQIEKERT